MAKRRRNLARKWIWIGAGAGALALTIGTVVVVRRRRGATPQGGGEGSVGPGGATPWYVLYQTQLRKLCGKPQTLTEQDRSILIEGVFLPAWRSYRSQISPQPGPQELEDAFRHVGQAVIDQACQSKGPGSLQTAAQIAKGAWLMDQGVSGQ